MHIKRLLVVLNLLLTSIPNLSKSESLNVISNKASTKISMWNLQKATSVIWPKYFKKGGRKFKKFILCIPGPIFKVLENHSKRVLVTKIYAHYMVAHLYLTMMVIWIAFFSSVNSLINHSNGGAAAHALMARSVRHNTPCLRQD